ncbi:MAG: copper amine oxidase N-terminal domain-containing protein [Candidatus Eremiobacteraeota bacterium]|nr:copper amine oxidase N-terminal domain-containing protein [Candidatus Eremiobacteraeota bacterium]
MKTLIVTGVIALAVSAGLAFSRPVEVHVDGQKIVTDVPPVTQNQEVFVPLRAVAEALGADTRFEPKENSIEIVRGSQTLEFKVGSTKATLNNAPMTLHHAPFRVRGRVMVGLRSVALAFGVKTRYNRRTARIDVDTPGVIEAGAQPDTDASP